MQWLLPSLAAGVVLGVVVGDAVRALGDPGVPWWPVALMGLGVVGIFALRGVRRRPWVALVCLGVVLGFGVHVGSEAPGGGLTREWGRDTEAVVDVEGVVVESARLRRKGRWSGVLRLSRCDGRPCDARVLLGVEAGDGPWVVGDRLVVSGRWWWPARAAARYLPDKLRWMTRRGLAGGVVAEAGEVRRVARGVSWQARLGRWRLGREAWIRARLGDERAGLVLAILTGSRGLVGASVRRPIDDAGLSHLLAISGLHLMLLAGFFFKLGEKGAARWLDGPRSQEAGPWLATLLGLAVVAGFAALVGWPVSVRRAFVMLVCWRASGGLKRRGALGSALSAAVLVIVLGDSSHAIFDPGLQLSVTALVGIGIFSTEGGDRRQGPREKLAEILVTSVACTVTCAPWLLWHFGRLPVVGVVLNLVAIPLTQAGLVFGLLALGLSGVWAWGAGCLLEAGAWFLGAMGVVADVVPLGGVALGIASVWGLVAALGVGGAMVCAGWPRLGAVLVLVGCVMSGLGGGSAAEVRFLPVGQGDAILIRDGRGHSVLIDCPGSVDGGSDPGERVVKPALLRLGVSRLDVVVVSHGDADHIGGLPSIVRGFRPREVWWQDPQPEVLSQAALIEAADEVGARIVEPPSWAVVGGVGLRRVDPGGGGRLEAGLTRNERSVVYDVEVAGLRVLLTGDVEALGEWRALSGVRPVHVLKVAHHGSRTSSSTELLARVDPVVAVIQSGRGNRFGHPHEEVMARLEGAASGGVFDTARCGEVVVRPVSGRLRVEAAQPCGSCPGGAGGCKREGATGVLDKRR